MTMSSSLAIVWGTLALTTVLFVVLLLFRQDRSARYNQERQEAELEKLRAFFESKIYGLTDRLLATEDRWRDVNHLVISTQTRQADIARASEVPFTPLLQLMGITHADLAVTPDSVFVLIPFHSQFRGVFKVIQDTCSELGLRAVRGDEKAIRGDLFPHILRDIVKARIIVAVIDGRNPNVFYELGVAQTLGKSTILLAASPKGVPIDLRTNKIVLFKNHADLRQKLQTEITRSLALGMTPLEVPPVRPS